MSAGRRKNADYVAAFILVCVVLFITPVVSRQIATEGRVTVRVSAHRTKSWTRNHALSTTGSHTSTPSPLLNPKYPLRRCLNVTKGHPDRTQEPRDWSSLRVDYQTAWARISELLKHHKARHHLEWGNLISWQRDCDFNWRDHDLDIAVWATDYSAELEHELVAFGKAWCPALYKVFRRRYHHPQIPGLVKPVQTQLLCDSPKVTWALIDIIWTHRRGANDRPVNDTGMLSSKSDEIEQPSNRQPMRIESKWWQSVMARAKQWYFFFQPYELVRADVLGVESLVPNDTSRHLTEIFGSGWRNTKNVGDTWRSNARLHLPVDRQSSLTDLEWWRRLPDKNPLSKDDGLTLVPPDKVRQLIHTRSRHLRTVLPPVKAP